MDSHEFKKFMTKQKEEIDKYKWIRSEKEGHDIGANTAAKEWIDQFASDFRKWWNNNNPENKI